MSARFEAEHGPEAAVGGLKALAVELRGRVDEACDDGGQCEVAWRQGCGEDELGRQAEQGRHMPVAAFVEGFKDDAALEESADGSTTGLGTFERLARVCRRIRFPSRQVFLRRTAGGLERLGIGRWRHRVMATDATQDIVYKFTELFHIF